MDDKEIELFRVVVLNLYIMVPLKTTMSKNIYIIIYNGSKINHYERLSMNML